MSNQICKSSANQAFNSILEPRHYVVCHIGLFSVVGGSYAVLVTGFVVREQKRDAQAFVVWRFLGEILDHLA